MNWYRRQTHKPSRTAALRMDVRGEEVVISGDKWFDTFNVKDKLKGMNFRWDGQAWRKPLSSLLGDNATLGALRGMGLPVDKLVAGGAPAFQQQQPAKPSTPMQVPPQLLAKPQEPWYLAKSNDDIPYALRRSHDGGWYYMTADDAKSGRLNGPISDSEAKNLVTSVRGKDGKPVTSLDPKTLLGIEPVTEPESKLEEPATDEKPAAPGRIPSDRISEHQRVIEGTFTKTNDNIMMNALAGTGKTTMLRHLASFKDPNSRWLYLVFNKKNQVEASTGKGKFPNGVEVLTSHAFLGKVLNGSADKGALPRTDLWEKGERLPRLLDEIYEHDDEVPLQFRFAAKKVVTQLASLAKANAIVPNDPSAPGKLREIIEKYQIDTDLSTDKNVSNKDWTLHIIDKTLEALQGSLPGQARGEFAGMRDHDDTLWYAATLDGVQWPRYDVVLADEVQDFNRCQSTMLRKLAEHGARIVAVGDKNQAIYMFRGADANAFDNVQSIVTTTERGGTPHNLPVNYRSGKKIIEYVRDNTHVKDLQAGKEHDGLVTEGQPYETMMGNLAGEWTSNNGHLKEQTAMIARTNRPLVKAALELLRNNIDFQIIGRDFSKELVQAVERLTGKGYRASHFPITQFEGRMQGFIADLEERWSGKISKTAELADLRNSAEALKSVIDYLESMQYHDPKIGRGGMRVRDTKDFIAYLRDKFAGVNMDTPQGAAEFSRRDPRSFVTLTTAHRSKGLEFDRVFIVGRELFPHPKSKTPDEIAQEDNAWYVALTRAMKELHVLQPEKKAIKGWLEGVCRFARLT